MKHFFPVHYRSCERQPLHAFGRKRDQVLGTILELRAGKPFTELPRWGFDPQLSCLGLMWFFAARPVCMRSEFFASLVRVDNVNRIRPGEYSELLVHPLEHCFS